jgi:hypothetical protein
MLVSIPPKYAVSRVVGYIKVKSAMHIARNYAGCKRNFIGQDFWARGYFVSTVGRDEETVKKYIQRLEWQQRQGHAAAVYFYIKCWLIGTLKSYDSVAVSARYKG